VPTAATNVTQRHTNVTQSFTAKQSYRPETREDISRRATSAASTGNARTASPATSSSAASHQQLVTRSAASSAAQRAPERTAGCPIATTDPEEIPKTPEQPIRIDMRAREHRARGRQQGPHNHTCT